MAILDELATRNDLTDTEQTLANYILTHAEEVLDMSSGTLAQVTHTSPAAVTRLCHTIGVDGFRTLCIQLARELEHDRMHLMDVNPDLPFAQGATTRDVMASVAKLSRQALDASYASIDPHNIRMVARIIGSARRVMLFASGEARNAVTSFSDLLLRLGVVCTPGDQSGDTLSVASLMGPSDVALVVSYLGTSVHAQPRLCELLGERKCHIVLVTANEGCAKLLPTAECVVRLPREETEQGRIATFYSQMCMHYALNCIYGELFARNWDVAMREHERILYEQDRRSERPDTSAF